MLSPSEMCIYVSIIQRQYLSLRVTLAACDLYYVVPSIRIERVRGFLNFLLDIAVMVS